MTKEGLLFGTATVGTVTDVAPLLRAMIGEQKRRQGAGGDATDEELRAAAAAFGDDLDANAAEAAEDVRERMQRSLPKGVRVERIGTRRDGTRVATTTTFAFDDARLLRDLEVFFERGRPGNKPFASFRVEEEGTSLVVEGMPPPLDAPLAGVPDEELKKFAVVLELAIRRPVLEHNATRIQGDALVWDLDGVRLRARTLADRGWIRARYARG